MGPNPLGNLPFFLGAIGQGGSAFSQGLAASDEHQRVQQALGMQRALFPGQLQAQQLQNRQMGRPFQPAGGLGDYISGALQSFGMPAVTPNADVYTAEQEGDIGTKIAQALAMMHYRNQQAAQHSPNFITDLKTLGDLDASAKQADADFDKAGGAQADPMKMPQQNAAAWVQAAKARRQAHAARDNHAAFMNKTYGSAPVQQSQQLGFFSGPKPDADFGDN